jgi:hypothetical protein
MPMRIVDKIVTNEERTDNWALHQHQKPLGRPGRDDIFQPLAATFSLTTERFASTLNVSAHTATDCYVYTCDALFGD